MYSPPMEWTIWISWGLGLRRTTESCEPSPSRKCTVPVYGEKKRKKKGNEQYRLCTRTDTVCCALQDPTVDTTSLMVRVTGDITSLF